MTNTTPNHNKSDHELTKLIIQKARDILEKEINPGVHDKLAEFGMNSFTTMRLIVELESELDIEFDDEDMLMDKISTIGKITQLIAKAKEEAAS